MKISKALQNAKPKEYTLPKRGQVFKVYGNFYLMMEDFHQNNQPMNCVELSTGFAAKVEKYHNIDIIENAILTMGIEE